MAIAMHASQPALSGLAMRPSARSRGPSAALGLARAALVHRGQHG